eukprot:IDg2381t1
MALLSETSALLHVDLSKLDPCVKLKKSFFEVVVQGVLAYVDSSEKNRDEVPTRSPAPHEKEAMFFFDRRMRPSQFNIHRLLITAVMISAKLFDNAWFSNNHYAKVGGLTSIEEMNRLELEMLKLLEFRVHVSLPEFLRFCYKYASSSRIKQP